MQYYISTNLFPWRNKLIYILYGPRLSTFLEHFYYLIEAVHPVDPAEILMYLHSFTIQNKHDARSYHHNPVCLMYVDARGIFLAIFQPSLLDKKNQWTYSEEYNCAVI